jgi:hypothetical protein
LNSLFEAVTDYPVYNIGVQEIDSGENAALANAVYSEEDCCLRAEIHFNVTNTSEV